MVVSNIKVVPDTNRVNVMSNNFKYQLWAGLGAAMVLFCMPLGIYTGLQGMKLQRRLKIGDYEEVEKCISHIKISWVVVFAFYILIGILAATGVFD